MALSPGELLRRHGLAAKKSWGQCFLHDRRIVGRIVAAAEIVAGDTVIEIGAGLGVLTRELAANAGRLIAIERDRDLVRVLRAELGDLDNVEIAEANALTFDYTAYDPPAVVVGNLPYNISSPILFRLVEQRRGVRSATLMLQRELAHRIVSGPGSRVYGVPSVLCQQHAEVEVCVEVGRGAFVPAPRVDSTVIKLTMRAGASPPALLDATVRAAFGQRRKTLLRALAARFDGAAVQRALAEAEIDGSLRAEVLGVEDFARLARALERAIG